MGQLIQGYRPDAARYAEHCYQVLVDEIASASTDVPEWETRIPAPVTATLVEYLRQHGAVEIERRYFDAAETLALILRAFDRCAADESLSRDHHRWIADSQFVGRSEHMDRMRELLAPGIPHEVAPVVIHGLTGCGKTSLAAQFGAMHSETFRPVLISAETRVSLLDGLARLASQKPASITEAGITVAGGPVTPPLPGNSATLLIIDGVTDIDTIRGIIPRQSLCRVLITSTVKHLDQGYEHVELSSWQPEESLQYLQTTLPDASDAQRALMAGELHHHPLAIVQAANHCRAMDRSVPIFLKILTREPLSALDIGEASGHPTSTLQAIKLNIEAAGERNPLARELLQVLAYLASDPVPLALFDERLAIADVANVITEPSPRPRRWAKWMSRNRPDERTGDRPPWHDPEGFRILKELDEQASRDVAIDTLLKYSLVSIRNDGLVLHPLIALVVRHLSEDILRWLELAFGIILSGGDIRALDEPDRADELLGHLSTLAMTALGHQFDGVAVHVAVNHLARRMAALGQISNGTDRRPDALYFGRKAVELSEAAATAHGGQYEGVAIVARETLAAIYYWLGETDLAIHYSEVNLTASHDFRDLGLYLRTLRSLAEIACKRGQRELAERILKKIERELTDAPLDDNGQFVVHQMKATILAYLGRTEEAASITESLVDHPSARDAESDAGTQLALRAAIRVARDREDITGLTRYQGLLMTLEERKRKPGRRPDRNLIDAIRGAADGAIDAGDLSYSQGLLDQAYTFAMDEFGEHSDMEAAVLGTRGRLYLHQRRFADARRDLEKSAQFYRRNPELSGGFLSSVLVHLAQVTGYEGHRQEALRLAREAYDLDLQHYGPDHRETRIDAEVIRLFESPPPLSFRNH